MKKIKNKKIYRILMMNYLKAFVLSLILGIVTVVALFYMSSYVSSEKDPSYAEKFMEDDYKKINGDYIAEQYGTMMVVNDNLEILKFAGNEENPSEFIKEIVGKDLNAGDEVVENNIVSQKYWSIFLYNMHYYRKGYNCSIKYNDNKNFYLIVKMPVAVSFLFSIDVNTQKEILPEALFILGFLVLVYTLILFCGMYVYSKITAEAFVKPLEKLCYGVKKLEEGNYKEHIVISGNGEFQSLAKSFNNLCATLEDEKKKRKETEDNRKRLILDISHDLKNPLTGVMGSLEMCMNLYENKEESHKINHYLRMAYNNSVRANSLTEKLFEFSKLESPDYKLNLGKVDFCEFMRLCILEEIDELEEAGIVGEYHIPDEPIYAMIDQNEFKRAVHNLISNCIKYNKRGTLIKVSLLKENNKIKLIIEDNGIGMDKSLESEIFTRFKRNNDNISLSKVNRKDGTGLGLAIVEKIVNLHKGKIELETDINKGCVFTIEIPEEN